MIEAYAFFAAFAVQVLVLSVLHPVWFTRYVRAKAEAQFPAWNGKSRERYLNLYRAVNAVIAVLGLVLLGWMFNDMHSADWHIASVLRPLSGYGVAQMVPIFLGFLILTWNERRARLHSPPPAKRTASLQRRGLFDIISPVTVFLAVAGYVLFAAFMIHIQQHPVAGFSAYFLLRVVTLVFAMNAICVYWLLYRRKKLPLETPAYRMQAAEVQVRNIVYASIAIVVFLSLFTALRLLHLVSWAPFALSVFTVIVVLLGSTMLFALRRQAEADRQGSRPVS